MHPACALIVWLAAVVGIQFVGYAGLVLLLAGALASAGGAVGRWFGYVRRARWLLLTLWLILAYHTPGDAFRELSWAPTYEGISEANLQAARLIVMLAGLTWLFVRLGAMGMICGLWGLLAPLRGLGVDVERLVVRLSLVLENLQTIPEKGSWRRMLASEMIMPDGPPVLRLDWVPWSACDTVVAAAAVTGLLGVLLL